MKEAEAVTWNLAIVTVVVPVALTVIGRVAVRVATDPIPDNLVVQARRWCDDDFASTCHRWEHLMV